MTKARIHSRNALPSPSSWQYVASLRLVAALVVLAAALELLRVRILPRRAFGPWRRAVARLWLIASCFSFVAITAVGSFEGFSRIAIAALPEAHAMRVEPARHPVFRYAVYLAGGLPFLAVVYGATMGRLRYRVVPVEVPITDLPPTLDGLCIVHLSDLHIGAFLPRAALRRPSTGSMPCSPILPC
jgi:uncharacterized protein